MFTFLNEVRTELTKVTWPTRSETIRLTLIVIAISTLVGLYLGALDFIFTELLKLIIS